MAGISATLILGAVVLAAAFAAYLYRSDKVVFPIVLALIGVVLCGAQSIDAVLPDGTKLQITGELAKSSDRNYQLIVAQQAVIDKFGQSLTGIQATLQAQQAAIEKLNQGVSGVQTSLQQLGGHADAGPAVVPAPAAAAAAVNLKQLEATRADLGLLLGRSKVASTQAMVANRELRAVAGSAISH